MTDFRAALKPRSGPKPGSEIKTNTPTKVDFRSLLNKKDGSSKAPAATPPTSSAPSDFRSALNKKKASEPEKNETNEQISKPAPKTPQRDKQSEINGVNGGVRDKKANATENATTEKKSSSTDAGGPNEKKEIAPEKSSQEKKRNNGEIAETNNKAKTVNGGKNSAGKPPVFSQPLGDITVVDGERLRLECQVTSDPQAVITWILDGKVVKPSKFIVLSQEGEKCSLTIDKALPEDEGRYKCRAENADGKAECSCMVIVEDPSDLSTDKKNRKSSSATPTTENEARIKKKPAPTKQGSSPQFLQFPGDQKIRAGEKVELLCNFGGTAPITCTWLKFKKPIQAGSGGISIETTENSSQLTITASDQDHCGCYTLELQNKFGTKQSSLNLTVVDKPDPPAGVPAASDIRKSSLTLSWYGPTYDGGSIVQSYNLELWNSMENTWKDLTTCNSTSYHVQNLLADRQYKFRVRAVNMYGVGEPSAESEPITVGVEEVTEKKEEEVGATVSEDEPEYRDVAIKKDCSIKDFYDVEDRLGTGKFGQVFKLVEKTSKKVWAGKFIKAFSQKDKENVRQEICIMNSLHHPKLVQCVDAFEAKTDMVMVMEMISGGELFERIVDEDFELTEREVIKYMLQIIDGVQFIHKQGIVHLDLKPENIMCVNKTGSKIKLIDFGLARRLEDSGTLKVMFGTPEFVAPEVINYEAISYPTDMWSIGVICYILVSGLSPFMGENDNETLANVTSATWDFEDEAFDEISDQAKDFISSLLKKDMRARLTCAQCLEHSWLKQDTKHMEAKQLSKERMKKYILRRRWQKTGNAVRAISRFSSMGMLGGIGPKKGSPNDEDPPAPFLECIEDENHTPAAPTFSSVIRDVEVVEGSAARFDCKIEGYPDPEVVWYKDDQPIKETRHFQIDYEEDGHCSLVISEVCPDDDAKYTCKAVNSLGEATCTAELMVEFMQEEEGEGDGEGEEEEQKE
ncbi:myosin light chain kinase, smooth muscle-like isoform X1 [Myxocyprinus asiaticus]|uniref:myosin light chain kinase, smooth muscle-like isoform X1 n=1 Tax=Myxocyprinus asiaticus TaxID=70543 RepID=UPI002221556A|nr:myosin light chain kinase, smooth muscle-like isoform X1 [Myxocyprinus asiaticus]